VHGIGFVLNIRRILSFIELGYLVPVQVECRWQHRPEGNELDSNTMVSLTAIFKSRVMLANSSKGSVVIANVEMTCISIILHL
jgi:hypothetical protein